LTQGLNPKINDYDRNAVQAAVDLKQGFPDAQITLVSVGHNVAEKVIREAMAMGADKAYVVNLPQGFMGDPQFTAAVLARVIEQFVPSPDLILGGDFSEDNYSGQVPPALAAHLDMWHVSHVAQISLQGSHIQLERIFEDERTVVEASLPGIITVNSLINNPKMPPAVKILRVPRSSVNFVPFDDLWEPGSAPKTRTSLIGFEAAHLQRRQKPLPDQPDVLSEALIKIFSGQDI